MPYTLVPDLKDRSRQVVLDGSRRVITHKSPYVAKDEAELLRCAQSSRGLRIQELNMTTAQFMERVEQQEAAEKAAKPADESTEETVAAPRRGSRKPKPADESAEETDTPADITNAEKAAE